MKILAGQYVKKDSPVHSLHPATKLLVLIAFTVLIVSTNSWFFHLVGVLLLAIFTVVSKIEWHRVKSLLRLFWFFGIFTFLLHFLFTPGKNELNFWIFHISQRGFFNGILYSIRLFMLIWAASLFGWTTSPIELGDSMEKIFSFARFFGVYPRDISMIFIIAMRFIPTLMDDARQILWAQRARGVSFTGGLRQKVKNIIPLVIPLFVVAFRRADKLALALQIRGYDSRLRPTRIVEVRFRAVDYLVIVGAVIMAIAPLIWVLRG